MGVDGLATGHLAQGIGPLRIPLWILIGAVGAWLILRFGAKGRVRPQRRGSEEKNRLGSDLNERLMTALSAAFASQIPPI